MKNISSMAPSFYMKMKTIQCLKVKAYFLYFQVGELNYVKVIKCCISLKKNKYIPNFPSCNAVV